MVSFLLPFSLFAFLLVLMVGGIVQVHHYCTIVHLANDLVHIHEDNVLSHVCTQSVIFIAYTGTILCTQNESCLYPLTPSLQLFFWSQTLEFVLSIGGALLFCGFIIFDTHIIMHKLSPEEYILASINLYLDFINLFIYILRILQAARKD